MSKHEQIGVSKTHVAISNVVEYETENARVRAVLKSKAAKKAAKGSSMTVMTLALAACGGEDGVSLPGVTPTGTNLTLSRSADGVYSATSVQGFSLPSSSVASLRVADAATNAYSILLDADGTGILEFTFTDANDVVTLQAGSTIDGFGTLKVTSGTLDATVATITGVTRVAVTSATERSKVSNLV